MGRSFYNAFSGIAAYQSALAKIGDNLANLNTNAHKRSEVSFTELLYSEMQEKGYSVDPLPEELPPHSGKGVHMYPVTKIFDQGALQQTERPLDLAIEGEGFFRIERQGGTEAYTRRGSFFVDNDGSLVTDRGDYLDVEFDLDGILLNSVVVGPNGQVSGENFEGDRVDLGDIMLYSFVNKGGLFKLGGGLYEATESSGEPDELPPGGNGAGSLNQYHLEASNVDMSAEMVELIANQRALEGNTRSMITADELKALTLLVRG